MLYNNTKKSKQKEAKGGLNQRSHVTWEQVILAVTAESLPTFLEPAKRWLIRNKNTLMWVRPTHIQK